MSKRATTRGQGYATQVEGKRAVRELLVAGRRRVRSVWIAGDGLAEIVDLARSTDAELRFVDAAELARRARTEVPQGVVAVAEPLQPVDLGTLLDDPRAFLVALDGVTDPQNVGAVIRSAETSGVTGLVLPRHRSAPISPAVVKAAAGAIEYLPIAVVSGIPAAIGQAERAGTWSVGLEPGGDTSIFELSVVDRSLMLVFGSEGSGLSRLARERCDVLSHIPRYGHVESLNVAAAVAITCCEVARSRSG